MYGVTIKYYYMAQKLKISWVSSPRNDSLADSICLMILQINEKTSPQLVQMLEITSQGRKKQEFQLKLQMNIESYFSLTSMQDSQPGKITIYTDESKQSHVLFNIITTKVD